MVLADRKLKVRGFKEATYLHNTLPSGFDFESSLTINHKRHYVTISKKYLELFNCSPNELFIIMDQISETKQQSQREFFSGENGAE